MHRRPRGRNAIAAMLALLLGVASTGCGDDGDAGARAQTATPLPTLTQTFLPTPTSTPSPFVPRLLPLHAEPDPVGGGRIVDAEGREVLLRGVNVNAFVEYWSANDFPTTFPLTPADADLMAQIGWNTVRLLLSWSWVEPHPGEYDDDYLDDIESAVRLLADRGIYSVIDLHQDAWSATLTARLGEACDPPAQPALGWDGAPAWATIDGNTARCAAFEIRETSPAVLAAFQAFWNDTAGIRTRYVRMLGHIAGRFARDAAVAGYDIMNEPNAFTPQQQGALADLYSDALAAIRAAEEAAGGFAHLVFFEPSALWSATGAGAPPDFARDRDVVYAPHLYTGGFDNGPISREAFQIALDEARSFGGAPVFSGEWGSDPGRATDSEDGYFLTHQRLQDDHFVSATLWTWRESCGDPHKAADYRAGRIPAVWGEFEVDCTTNAITGMRMALIDQLTRALVRAAPGRTSEIDYDPASGGFAVSGTDAAPGGEVVVFYPAGKHGVPRPESSGLIDLRHYPAPGGNVYVVGRTTQAEWSLTF